MLLIEWAHGWSVSRGARMPVSVDGGVRIDVSRPAARSRYVRAAFDRTSVSRLGQALVVSGNEIKTLAAPAALMWAGKIAEACGWPHEVRRFGPQPSTE
jgi:hypothetical protein